MRGLLLAIALGGAGYLVYRLYQNRALYEQWLKDNDLTLGQLLSFTSVDRLYRDQAGDLWGYGAYQSGEFGPGTPPRAWENTDFIPTTITTIGEVKEAVSGQVSSWANTPEGQAYILKHSYSA